jgi:hypothetical protein
MEKRLALVSRLAFASVFITFLVGCGSSGPPSGTVTGTVTMGGKPVSEVSVFFDTKGGTGTGRTNEEGKYQADVPLGDAKVTVLPPPLPGNKQAPPIYKKYGIAANSGLTLTVKSGKQEFNIDMK